MALSCIGINKTPAQIITSLGGNAVPMIWGTAYKTFLTPTLEEALSNYHNNCLKYAPPIVKVRKQNVNGAKNDHWAVVLDKRSNGYFTCVDPGYSNANNMWNTVYDSGVKQYYKP